MCKAVVSLTSVLLVLLLACNSSLAQMPYSDYRLCSEKLNDMMMMVCDEFNSIMPQKRGMSKFASELDPLDPIQYVEANEEPGQLTSPLLRGRFYGGEVAALNSLASIRRRTREGIVDRCCKHTCPYAVLMEYCSVAASP
ncbi:probable insulin-like peptide 2 isoform X2 [Drosophila kikkawai]|uniref:Probable insulin-like peptide 2 isoform X2 n=1 Tax=Drosophila kikkawai TaxID=30033 RepID=A0A6P4IJN3_DROKI|nr:probable insulin-like peptide 2 isoform X2 [Drosophila kikkawai]